MANETDTFQQIDNQCNFNNNDFWFRYKEYLLKSVNNRTALDRLNYAKKYSHILINGNAQEILSLSNEKRVHVMKSLNFIKICRLL